jgi:hypothetical protein
VPSFVFNTFFETLMFILSFMTVAIVLVCIIYLSTRASGSGLAINVAQLGDARMEDAHMEDAQIEDAQREDPQMEDPQMEDPQMQDPQMQDTQMGDPQMRTLKWRK